MAIILVADDNQRLADSIEEMLHNEGYEVLLAADGEAALDLAREQRPDLIVLDVLMPKMDGLEVCAELRRDPDLCQTLVLMLTVEKDAKDVRRGFHAGVDDYLGKPFHMNELLARARALLRRRAPRDT